MFGRPHLPKRAGGARGAGSTGRCEPVLHETPPTRPPSTAAASRPGQPRKMIMLLALAALAGANEAHDWVIRDPATIRCAAMSSSTRSNSCVMPCSVMGDANLIGDARHVDGHGNRLSCRCPVGFTQTAEECVDDALTDGTCGSLSCEACNAGWTTSLSDSSACTTGVTSCAANHRLVERDASGNVTENFCEGLPERPVRHYDRHTRAVRDGSYKASPYECQTCPDADMAYSSAEKACTCTTGARVGVAAVGPNPVSTRCSTTTRSPSTPSLRRRTSDIATSKQT